MHDSIIGVLTTVLSITSLLHAQTPCADLVPNGDFSQVVTSPWILSGGASATYEINSVIGALPSRCIRLVPSGATSTLTQPTLLTMQKGDDLELAADFASNFNLSVEFGFTPLGGTRKVIGGGNPTTIRIGLQRVSLRHVPATTETGVIDLTFQTGVSGGIRFYIDNITLRQNRLMVSFPQTRGGTLQHWTLHGTPNRNYGLFIAAGLVSTPIPLSGCSGLVWLDTSLFAIGTGSIGQTGLATGQFPIPRSARGIPFYFQAIDFPPCGLGCPLTTAF